VVPMGGCGHTGRWAGLVFASWLVDGLVRGMGEHWWVVVAPWWAGMQCAVGGQLQTTQHRELERAGCLQSSRWLHAGLRAAATAACRASHQAGCRRKPRLSTPAF